MSIFQQKFCPQCSDRQPLAAPRCICGYLFEVEQVEDDTHAAELHAQQERIFLDYLAARAAQAEEAHRVAKRLLEADPESVVKSADVLVAQQQMHAAQAELSAQVIKTRAAMERAEALRRSKPAPAAPRHVQAGQPDRRASASPESANDTPPAKDTAQSPPSRLDPAATQPRQNADKGRSSEPPVSTRPVPVVADSRYRPTMTAPARPSQNVSAAPVGVAPQPRTRPTVTTASAPPPALPDANSGCAAATPMPAKAAAPAQAASASPTPPSVTAADRPSETGRPAPVPPPSVATAGATMVSAQPTAAFRQAQAAKARDIVNRRKSTIPARRTRPEAVVSPKTAPPPAATPRMEETKECPSCTATVALPVMQCRCGFAFSAGVELPAVVLTPTERAALFQGFELTGPRKPA